MKDILKNTIMFPLMLIGTLVGFFLFIMLLITPLIVLGILHHHGILDPDVNHVGSITLVINIFWLGFIGALNDFFGWEF